MNKMEFYLSNWTIFSYQENYAVVSPCYFQPLILQTFTHKYKFYSLAAGPQFWFHSSDAPVTA